MPLSEIIDELFLFEKWVVFMQAYLDESGKHGKAEVITIAGVVFRNREAKIVQREWPKALGVVPMPYHHTDFLKGRAPFDFLTEDERRETQSRLINKVSKVDYLGVAASLVRADWDACKDRIRMRPEFRDPWFFVFESAICEIMHRTEDAGRGGIISLVVDRQEEFQERASALYQQILRIKGLPYYGRLGGLSFMPKNAVCPLQYADMFTYEANVYARETKVKRAQAERWQMRQIREGRPVGQINGVIWNREHLEEVAELKAAENTSAFSASSN